MPENIQEKIENKIIDQITTGASGRLITFKPEKDAKGADLIVERRGEYKEKALSFKVNSFIGSKENNSFVKDFLQDDFKADKDFYLLFVSFDEVLQKINEHIWLIPSLRFKDIADSVISPDGKKVLRFQAPLDVKNKNRYSKYLVNIKELGKLLIKAFESGGKFDFKDTGFEEKEVINLEGLKEFTSNITTIVTVTDTGRSTGIIRRELNMPAPGDIRNCLLALANSERLMYDLFQYRFENGTLEGYSFGNLFIAALTKLTGSFEKAIEEASKILKLEGKVLPSTLDNVNICAELEDGNILEQEDSIIDRHNNYVHLRSKIKRVFHKPEARVNEKVLKTIEEADLIVLSPGSLFTSIIGNLLIKGIPEAINKSKAKKVYVCNIMTQVSQTHQYKASEHIKEIIKYLKGDIDYAVLNSGKPSNELLESYRRENAFLVENDIEVIKEMGVKVIVDDLLDDVDEKKLLWEKKDLLRHNPSKIGELLVRLV